jgi:hypothetical protein
MKKSIIIIAAIFMMGFSSNLMAQITENTIASGEIISQLTITETSPLYFGKMAVLNLTGGTCVLSTAAVRTPTLGVNLSASTPTNAEYDVTGENNATYAITVDPTITVTKPVTLETMTINSMKLKTTANATERNAAGATSTLSGTGTDHIVVGGTLNVAAGQVKGVYSGTFDVTVAYN